MSTIRALEDPTILDVKAAHTKEPSARTIAQREAQAQADELVGSLTDPAVAYAIDLDPNEKPLTVRLRLLKAAKRANKQIVVRKHGDGLAVGLYTPERATKRGRKPKAETVDAVATA